MPNTIEAGVLAEDVRGKYFDATRSHPSYNSMKDARVIGEWVSKTILVENGQEITKELAELGSRLDWIESRVKKEALAIPRYVLAGLRTLQAYGNYASHTPPGAPPLPPDEAAESARASLVLVTEWFMTRPGSGLDTLSLPLREPAPPKPGFFEARSLANKLGVGFVPRISQRHGKGMNPHQVDISASPKVQVAQLEALLAEHVDAAERVARMVLARETTLDVAKRPLIELSMLMLKLADRRSAVIPRSISVDLEELERLRAKLSAESKLMAPDPTPFFTALEERQHASNVVDWAHRTYLSRSHVERHLGVYMIAAFFIVAGLSICADVQKAPPGVDVATYRDQIRARHCAPPVPDERRALCEELAQPIEKPGR